MRVGFVRHRFLPPTETFIYTLLTGLDRYRPSVFALERLAAEKFPYDDLLVLGDARFGRMESLLYRLTTYSPRLFRWAKGMNLLHAHFGQTGVHALLAARRWRIPLVTSYYGYDVTLRAAGAKHGLAYGHYRLLARRLWRHGARFLVLSRDMKDDLARQGCPEEKIRIVPLGVDLSRFATDRIPRLAPGPTTVLMVGREIDKKGFDDGLRACAFARADGADLRVVFLGTDLAAQGALRALAGELGLAVEWRDPASSVAAAMAEADIMLVPSRTSADGNKEGTPTVICEAGAAGLPVVSTRHAGIPEQVADGVTGLLAAERAPAALGAHLARLHRDPAARLAMGLAGRDKMQREYSLAALRDNVQAVYAELLEGGPPWHP